MVVPYTHRNTHRKQSISRSHHKQTLSKQTSLRKKSTPNELLENHLLTGNCLPLLARLPSGSVDLTVTSPPYDNLRCYDTPTLLDLPALGEALFRVTKEGGVCIVVIGDASRHFAKSLTSFRLALSWCDHAGEPPGACRRRLSPRFSAGGQCGPTPPAAASATGSS